MQDFTTELQPSDHVTEKQKKYLLITYIIFAVGFFTGGLVTIAGLVMAYLKRSDYDNSIYQGHVTYLIRTFWIGLLYGFISLILTIVGIGIILGILTTIWFIIRVVKGFVTFYDDKPLAKPSTWLF